MRELLGSGS